LFETQEAIVPISQDKLSEHIGGFLCRLINARTNTAVLEPLRMYEALAENPTSVERLAKATGTNSNAIAEWLGNQVARGHVQYDAVTERYWVSEDQACELSREPGLTFVRDAFEVWRGTRLLAR
jgi:hypothetical protein